MSELLQTEPERTLWFDGPNYTADAIIIDPDAGKLLLIQRGDTGEWALPGGFIDPDDDSSHHAAIREAKEEAGIDVSGQAPRVFHGIVDDPRNCDTAWIETSAHVFVHDHAAEVHGNDDAIAAAWHDIGALPPLYASHAAIIERGLDHIDSLSLLDTFSHPEHHREVDAGHMEYDKAIYEKDGQAVFAKQCDLERFNDVERAMRSYRYLEKEAATLAHLRQHGFAAIPERSILHNETLAMDALQPEDGWQWHAEPATFDQYVAHALDAFAHLETMPVPADSFAIEPTYESLRHEGWRALNHDHLRERVASFLPRLTPEYQAIASELLHELPDLRRLAAQPRDYTPLVFCHHDVRQSNLAWHPEHGTKLVDWSWADLGESGSDSTGLLIDLHKSGHDITAHHQSINPAHCLTLIGFWLAHSTWPIHKSDEVRFQQLASAISAYDILRSL